MKNLIRQTVQSFGFDIIKKNHHTETSFQLILESFIRTKKYLNEDFFLVQIGANDGVTNDPIQKFLIKNNCNALLVEPLPDVFEKLKNNYNRKDINFVNAAIFEKDTLVPIYRISPKYEEKFKSLYKPNANPSGITSLNPDYVKNFLIKLAPKYFKNHNIDEWIEKILVPGITFDTLVNKYKIAKIDVLQIDTEGYDFEVLKMAFASKIDDPLVINFEYKCLNNKEIYTVINLLLEKDYCIMKHGGEICAYKSLIF